MAAILILTYLGSKPLRLCFNIFVRVRSIGCAICWLNWLLISVTWFSESASMNRTIFCDFFLIFHLEIFYVLCKRFPTTDLSFNLKLFNFRDQNSSSTPCLPRIGTSNKPSTPQTGSSRPKSGSRRIAPNSDGRSQKQVTFPTKHIPVHFTKERNMWSLKWTPFILSVGERVWKSCSQRFQWRAVHFARAYGSRESKSHWQTDRTTTTAATTTSSRTTTEIKGNAPCETYAV